jgi:hypothetical protein
MESGMLAVFGTDSVCDVHNRALEANLQEDRIGGAGAGKTNTDGLPLFDSLLADAEIIAVANVVQSNFVVLIMMFVKQ